MRAAFSSNSFRFFAFLMLLVFSIDACAQTMGGAGTIQGTVLDSTGAVVPGAKVEISNPVTGFSRSTVSDAAGSFLFRNVPENPYHLSAQAPGFAPMAQDVDVRSSVPITLELRMNVASASTTVEVRGEAADLLENSTSAHTDVDDRQVAKVPMESTVSGLSQVLTLATPGVVADSNGFFHPLGDHAQTSFSIDSQPISDQQSRVYTNQVSMSAVQSLEVISGVAPAEYGDKTSLVAVVTTKSGLGLTHPTGSISFNYGSFGTAGTTINVGLGNSKFGNFLSLNGLNTGRFLDTPEFRPLHDKGNSETFFDRVDFQPNGKDSLHLNLFAAHTWFQAPNTFDQAAAGQDQRQNLKTFNIAPGWTHLFNPTTLLTGECVLSARSAAILSFCRPVF